MPIIAGVAIGAEEALLSHEREQHAQHDSINTPPTTTTKVTREDFDIRRFLADHKYEFCIGAWVAGVAGMHDGLYLFHYSLLLLF